MPTANVKEAQIPVNADVPAGAPSWITPELVTHTLRVWNPYYGDSLTSDDAVNILMNVSRLVGVLSRS